MSVSLPLNTRQRTPVEKISRPQFAAETEIMIVRVVVAPHFLQAYVKSHRSVSSETATGGDGVIGRLQPGQVTVG